MTGSCMLPGLYYHVVKTCYLVNTALVIRTLYQHDNIALKTLCYHYNTIVLPLQNCVTMTTLGCCFSHTTLSWQHYSDNTITTITLFKHYNISFTTLCHNDNTYSVLTTQLWPNSPWQQFMTMTTLLWYHDNTALPWLHYNGAMATQ